MVLLANKHTKILCKIHQEQTVEHLDEFTFLVNRYMFLTMPPALIFKCNPCFQRSDAQKITKDSQIVAALQTGATAPFAQRQMDW